MSKAVVPSQPGYSQQDLQDLVTLALAEARGLGASEAEVGASVETGLSVTARLREVETLEYQRDRGEHRRSERERDPRHRREGLQHRGLHRRGRGFRIA